MRAIRALRGVAALRDLPPLAEVVDAVDAAAKPIELGQETATAERRRLFRTAARVLLEGGDAVRRGSVPPTDSLAVREFALAAESLRGNEREDDHVVPIASLFPDDAGASVQPAPNPPTTAAQRFRLEVVSQAEHLRRLVGDARDAGDAATRDRLGRELRGAVRTLARAAQSFAALEIANVFLAAERGAAALEPDALEVLDTAGRLLSDSRLTPESAAPRFLELSQRLATTTPSRPRVRATPAWVPPVPSPTTAATGPGRTITPMPPRAVTPARGGMGSAATGAASPTVSPVVPSAVGATSAGAPPSGAALQSLLATGIAGLEPLGDLHLATPLVGDEDDVVPIDELLFRGRDALTRAIEIGAGLREAGRAPDTATLDELYDLLQLAAAD
jgi:hypothetical protein